MDRIFRGTICFSLLTILGAGISPTASAEDVLTYHYNNQRTGWDQNETILTPAKVGEGGFGVLITKEIDSGLVGHPLIATHVPVSGSGTHDVAYVVSNYNYVTAIDANTGATLLHVSLGTPVPGSANPLGFTAGIQSTPVIDPSTRTLFVLADTYVDTTPTYFLHALDLDSLKDRVPPMAVSASSILSDGSVVNFDAKVQAQHPALLLENGNVYAAFGSFGDLEGQTSRGWLLAWNAATLKPLSAALINHNASSAGGCPQTPAPPCYLSSIWMSGYGPASDGNAVYVVTGNGGVNTYSPEYNLSESALKITPDLLRVHDYFTPNEANTWDVDDNDFGLGGITILDTQPGRIPHLAVVAGKSGTMYLLNRDAMGHNVTKPPNDDVDEVAIGGCWCGQSYFNAPDGIGRVVSGGGTNVEVWKVVTSPRVGFVLESKSPTLTTGKFPGYFTTISSNGTAANTGIIWAIARPATIPGTLTLYALNAADLTTLATAPVGAWTQTGNAFITPVVANGKIYVANGKTVYILGLPARRPITSLASLPHDSR
jgi:hypothetical protein